MSGFKSKDMTGLAFGILLSDIGKAEYRQGKGEMVHGSQCIVSEPVDR